MNVGKPNGVVRLDLEVRVLGPISVVGAGKSVELSPQQRRLVAALVVNRHRPVSVDRLLDYTYGDDQPGVDL